jgi:hypothetical protein
MQFPCHLGTAPRPVQDAAGPSIPFGAGQQLLGAGQMRPVEHLAVEADDAGIAGRLKASMIRRARATASGAGVKRRLIGSTWSG